MGGRPTRVGDMGFIWHTQVVLILIGHVASVYLPHVVALRVFPTRREAILSQVPLLLLMVAYTAIGLYILSLPLAASTFVESRAPEGGALRAHSRFDARSSGRSSACTCDRSRTNKVDCGRRSSLRKRSRSMVGTAVWIA